MKILNNPKNIDLRKNLRMNVMMPERILWKYLKNRQLGYKFRRQQDIGKYVVDFYCAEIKLVLEIDGRIHDEIMERDNIREKFIQNLGFGIKRYTAKQVNEELDWVLEDLKRFCDELKRGCAGKGALA